MSQQPENNNQHILDSLRRSKVLTTQDEKFGMPAKIFIAGIGLSFVLSVTVYWLFGPLFAILYFPAMYSIHKDDPHALKVWKGTLTQKYLYWSAGRYKSVTLKIIDNSFTNQPKKTTN